MFSVFDKKRDKAILINNVVILVLAAGILDLNIYLFNTDRIASNVFWLRVFYTVLLCGAIAGMFVIEGAARFRLPFTLELILPMFTFLCLGLGECLGFYQIIPFWDKILHTSSGIIFTFIGLALADILFKDKFAGGKRIAVYMIFAFLIVLAEGYIWELLEFTFDSIVPAANSQSWAEGLIETLPDGTFIVSSARGAGLIDTMGDLIVNFFGSVVTVCALIPVCIKKPRVFDRFAVKKYPKIKEAEATVLAAKES